MKGKAQAVVVLLLLATNFGSAMPQTAEASARSAMVGGSVLDGKDVNPEPIVPGNRDGSKLLDQLSARIKQLGPYKFDGVLGTAKEKAFSVDYGSFFFMPMSLLRVEVKSGGYKNGSVLVKQRDGIIKARGGRALLGMKMTLEPHSNLLQLANGLNIVECDLMSLMQWLQKQISAGQKVYASDSPIQVESQPARVLVLETRDNNDRLAHRVLIDPQKQVPVEWDIFKEGKFFSTVRFNNFQLVPAMDESLFQL